MKTFIETCLDLFLVEEIPVENATSTGVVGIDGQQIVRTEKQSRKPQTGVIVSCGDGFPMWGMWTPNPYKVGDVVRTSEFGRDYILLDPEDEFKPQATKYYLIHFADIQGKSVHRECPGWFADRLASVGGRNQYGEPKFKLVWGQSATMRDGGYFSKDDFEGYRDVPAIGGEACWALMMWEPAEVHGTAYRWYKDNTDEVTGLVTLGQYPYKGRYRIIRKLIHRELVEGEWYTTRMEPTHFILDVMIPMIVGWNRLSNAKRLEVINADIAKEEAEGDRILADSRSAHRVNRNGLAVQRRMELMERTMSQAMDIARRTQPGMRQIGA